MPAAVALVVRRALYLIAEREGVLPDSAPGSPPFQMSTNERMLWGVHYSDNVLRLRTTGARQAAGVLLVVALCVFTAVGVVATTAPTTTIFFFTTDSRIVFVIFGALAILVATLLLLVGSVVATPDGIARRWFGVRRLRWDEVDYLRVVEQVPPWWIFGAWFAVEVVEVSTRDGHHLTLWPTRCTLAQRSASDGPTPAQVKRNLLQRYRESCAPEDESRRGA